jgi:hypothetical protein
MVAGVSLAALARREFSHYGQPTDPGLPTSQIITTGVFSISRNPLYLGGVFILAGISLAFNLAWVIIVLIPSLLVCHYVLIAPEERYLAARFGEHTTGMPTIHRWIPNNARPLSLWPGDSGGCCITAIRDIAVHALICSARWHGGAVRRQSRWRRVYATVVWN